MSFINLTPHVISIRHENGGDITNIPPTGEVARVTANSTLVAYEGAIPMYVTEYGEVTGLPAPQEGVTYIVSGMVASAAPRKDVVSPGDLVRDAEGRPIGCKGLRLSL